MNRIPISRPIATKEMIEAAANALANERLVMGESVFKFEEEFARYIGTEHAVSVSSGTDALILAMIALDVRGHDVLTTPFSFVATATSIVHAGGTPLFSDVSNEDYNIDPLAIKTNIDANMYGIMPVDIFGYPAKMDEIAEAAGPNVKIIEDACQAHGASYKGEKCGAFGDVGCFSFYPTKNMTVGGDGGMITTNDERLANELRKLRDCGRVSRYEHDVFGFTSRLNTANAAFGRVQLRHLDEWNERRRSIARRYAGNLKDVDSIVLPPMGMKDIEPVFHLFAIRCDDRDALARHLGENGIDTAVHYPIPIHMQAAYRNAYEYKGGEFPISEQLSKQMLSLPMFPEMTNEQVDRVCQAINEHYA
ncbi:MAG TPA: DegT/DnrJ/EryC1/StrS family aminotransferase [Methanomassiliicoccaceae archaeon]|nr:DegT/DnrJ/EryC1/StrS family aminotransferase [Methanomassiliicoccaceae archaeon]